MKISFSIESEKPVQLLAGYYRNYDIIRGKINSQNNKYILVPFGITNYSNYYYSHEIKSGKIN